MENSNSAKACREIIKQYGSVRCDDFSKKLVLAALKGDEKAIGEAVNYIMSSIIDDVTAVITISNPTKPIYAATLYSIAEGIMATCDDKEKRVIDNIRNNTKTYTYLCKEK